VHHAGEGGRDAQVAGAVAAGGAGVFELGGDDGLEMAGEAGQLFRVDVLRGAQQDRLGGIPIGFRQVFERRCDDLQMGEADRAVGVRGRAGGMIDDPLRDLHPAGGFPGRAAALLDQPADRPEMGRVPARAAPMNLLDRPLDRRVQLIGQGEQPLGEIEQGLGMLTGQLKLLQRADRGLRRLQLSHSSTPQHHLLEHMFDHNGKARQTSTRICAWGKRVTACDVQAARPLPTLAAAGPPSCTAPR
jgi:hypothetical protein